MCPGKTKNTSNVSDGILISEIAKYKKQVCVPGAEKPIVHCAAVSWALATENKDVEPEFRFKARVWERAHRLFLFSVIRKALLKSPGVVTHSR